MPEKLTPCGCAICANAAVRPDPDPDDWFCDDDKKVICTAVPTDVKTGELATQNVITCACRPYNIVRETSYIPSWCPQHGQITPRTL